MRKISIFAVALAFLATPAIQADVTTDAKFDYAGHIGNPIGGQGLVSGPTLVYDVLGAPSAPVTGFTSTDLSATFGDDVLMTDTGWLDEFSLTVFNSATGNTGQIQTADVNVNFYDLATFNAADLGSNTAIGGFTGSLDFTGLGAGGLDPGFFITVNFTGLFAQDIFFNTTDLVVTQQLANITGGSTRAGVVFFDTQNVGGGDPLNWFASASDLGADGFYTFGSNANMGYAITLSVPEPSSLTILAIGFVGLVARRKR